MIMLKITGITSFFVKTKFIYSIKYTEWEKTGQPFLTMNITFSLNNHYLSLQANNRTSSW